MAEDKDLQKEVTTLEEANEVGYFGVVQSKLPNVFHEASSEAMRQEAYQSRPEDVPVVATEADGTADTTGQSLNAPDGSKDSKPPVKPSDSKDPK